MSTTQGDIAKPQLPLGERKDAKKNDMQSFVAGINKINAERTKRYEELVGKSFVYGPERDGVIRRIMPKKSGRKK